MHVCTHKSSVLGGVLGIRVAIHGKGSIRIWGGTLRVLGFVWCGVLGLKFRI